MLLIYTIGFFSNLSEIESARKAMAGRSVSVFDGIESYYHQNSGSLWLKVVGVKDYRIFELDEPDRIVLDIDNMVGSQTMESKEVVPPFVNIIRYAQIDKQTAKDGNLNPNTFRIVLDVIDDVKFELSLENEDLIIKVFQEVDSKLDFPKESLEEGAQNTKIDRLGSFETNEKGSEQVVEKNAIEKKGVHEKTEYEKKPEADDTENNNVEEDEKNDEEIEKEIVKGFSENKLEKPIKKELGNLKYVNEGDRKALIVEGGLLTLGTRNIAKRYTSKHNEDGKIYTISFSNVLVSLKEGVLEINDGTINSIEVIKDSEQTSIVINATEKFNYHVLSRNKVENTAITILPKVKPEQRVVVIDPGHGGVDPGAVYQGITEKELCLDIAIFLNDLLKEEGVQTYMLREEDSYLSTYERAYLANALDAKLFLSIHNNAALSNVARGSETLYFGPDHTAFNGKDFAKILQLNMIEMLGTVDRGIISRPELVVLRQTKMPAALVEIGFMTNPDDMKRLRSDDFKLKSAQSLKKSILEAIEALES